MNKFAAMAAGLGLLLAANHASATVLTFDDLGVPETQYPDINIMGLAAWQHCMTNWPSDSASQ